MASIQKVSKKSMSTSSTSISSPTEDKKLTRPKRAASTNIIYEKKNESIINRDIKSLLIRPTSSSHQSINSLFKLTPPITPSAVHSNKSNKKSSFKLFHSNDSSSSDESDSESDELSPKTPTNKMVSEPVPIPETTTPPLSPLSYNSYNKSSSSLNINSLLKDISALNFKYKNKNNFDYSPSVHFTSKNIDKVDQLLNSIKNKSNTKNRRIDSSTETLVNTPSDSTDSLDSLKNLKLSSPVPPPKTKLPDLPIPPPPKTKLPDLPTPPPPKTKLPDLPTPPSPGPAPQYLPPPTPLSSKDINLRSFNLVKTIGTGSFGRVHLVRSRVNHKFYAMKAMPKDHIAKEQQIEHIQEEKRILSQLHHPLFIQLTGTFQTRTHLFIVTNFVAGGELFAVLKKKIRFMNNIAKFYAAEVIIALEYLHSKDIIYRDLKPENIMLDVTGHIKLVDLGFAKHVPDVTYTLCGTPEYMAPEVILCKAYGKAVDWYALGILIYEMLCGYPPFYDQDQLQLYKKILSGKLYWPSYMTKEAKDLIEHLITPDLTKRYGNLKDGADDIKRHAWFTGVDWAKVERLGIPPPFIPEIHEDGDTRHFQRYAESCDKEYYISKDHEALLDGTNDYLEYFKDF